MTDIRGDVLDELPGAGSSPSRPTRPRCGRRSPTGRSRTTAASTRRRRACTSATSCSILTLRRLQQAGHRPLALVGGATGLIGDPRMSRRSGCSTTATTVAGWVERIRGQVEPFLDFDGPTRRADGQQPRLDGAAVGDRLPARRRQALPGQPDARQGGGQRPAQLARPGSATPSSATRSCRGWTSSSCTAGTAARCRPAASDQWGNLTAGTDLIHRVEGRRVHAVATPLITKADGTKFGKTEGGTVWLDPAMTQPVRLLPVLAQRRGRRRSASTCRVFTFRTPGGDRGARRGDARSGPRPGRRSGPWPPTSPTLVHGAEATRRVQEASQALFGRGDLAGLDAATLRRRRRASCPGRPCRPASTRWPTCSRRPGWCQSKSAARRTIAEGGAYVNNAQGRRRGRDRRTAPTCCTAGGCCCAGAGVRWRLSRSPEAATVEVSSGRRPAFRRGCPVLSQCCPDVVQRPGRLRRRRATHGTPRFDSRRRAAYCSHDVARQGGTDTARWPVSPGEPLGSSRTDGHGLAPVCCGHPEANSGVAPGSRCDSE